MGLNQAKFCFTTEEGEIKLSLAEFHKRPKLMELVGRQALPPTGRQTLFLANNVFSFSNAYLRQNPTKRALMEEGRNLYESNPLRYFIPQEQTVVDFLNWRSADSANTLKVLHAGVGSGKSWAGVVDWLLDIVPTSDDWELFKVFGVKRRPQLSAANGGVALVSYLRENLRNTLWPQVVCALCPRDHIKDYLTGKRTINWNDNPHCVICDTPIYMKVSSQSDKAFVSQALNRFHWDEQHGESKFLNANDRVTRRDGRHIMTMTPHKVEGVAESGAGTFIDRIRKGEMSTALDVKFFQMNKLKVNNWVVTAKEKKAAVEEYIEAPMREGNVRKLAEGRSKVYGEFHEASGLVFDSIDPDVHFVQRFEVPDHWTRVRYHDHGRKEPCAAILVCISPDGDYFVTEEYYVADEIPVTAKGIVRDMTKNDLVPDGDNGWREVMSQHEVAYTMGDPRSLSKGLDNARHSIQREYQKHGLNIRLGSGQPVEKQIPVLAELFYINPARRHFATKEKGAPGIYIFDDLEKTKWELENYRMKTARVVRGDSIATVEKPVKVNDHIVTCLLQLGMDRPHFIPKDERTRTDIYVDSDAEDGVDNGKRGRYSWPKL